jgi:hypothetical protein
MTTQGSVQDTPVVAALGQGAPDKSGVIREYQSGDREGVLALFRDHFGLWSTERWDRRWEWQFHGERGCGEARSRILVVESNGSIAGHIASFPLPLRIGSQRLEILSPCDFVVHADHRWSAFSLLRRLLACNSVMLGSGWSPAAEKLFRFCRADHLPLSQIRHVYPIRCTGEICRQLRYRLPDNLYWMANRWSATLAAPLVQRRWGLACKPRPPAGPRADLRTGIIARFGVDYDELWRNASRQFEISLDKDSAYCNWRYVDCPTASHFRLGAFDRKDRLAGVLVACRRTHRDRSRRVCGEDGEILELIVRDGDMAVARTLVLEAMRFLDRQGVDSIAATGLHLGLHPLLEELGFERTACNWGTVFAVSNDPARPTKEILQDRLWYCTSGDGDHLFDQGV